MDKINALQEHLRRAVEALRALPHQDLPTPSITVTLGSDSGGLEVLRAAGARIEVRHAQSLHGEVYDHASLDGDGYRVVATGNWRQVPPCTCGAQS